MLSYKVLYLLSILPLQRNFIILYTYSYYLFTVMSYNKPHTRILPALPTETELKIDIIRIHIPVLSFRRYFGFSVTLVYLRYGIPDFYPSLRFILGTGCRYHIYHPVTFGISDRKIRISQVRARLLLSTPFFRCTEFPFYRFHIFVQLKNDTVFPVVQHTIADIELFGRTQTR